MWPILTRSFTRQKFTISSKKGNHHEFLPVNLGTSKGVELLTFYLLSIHLIKQVSHLEKYDQVNEVFYFKLKEMVKQ